MIDALEPRERRYVVVALFQPVQEGTSFPRSRWPAHVTVAGNFTAAASRDDLAGVLRRAGALDEPLLLRFAGTDRFGPARDLPVRLVESGPITTLHLGLTAQLEQLDGYAADEPAHRRGGYRPHLTLGPSSEATEGESRRVRSVAVAELSDDTASIVVAFDLPEVDHGDGR